MSESGEPVKTGDEQTLVFRVKLTEQDVVDLNCHNDSLLLRKRFRRLFAAVMFGLAALSVIGMMIVGPFVAGFAMIVIAYLAIFGLAPWRRWQIRRHYRRHRDKFHDTTILIGPQSVSVESAGAKSEFDWKQISIVAHTVDGLLVCTQRVGVLFWLPSRVVTANSEQLILQWAKQKNICIRQV
jgi:hypothetical protein